MKDKKKLLYTGLLLLGMVAVITVNTASSKNDRVNVVPDAKPPQWVYSAKFVCGQAIDNTATNLPAPVVPADYRTAINVHNPQSKGVEFTKKVAVAASEFDRLIPPSNKTRFGLGPDFAFEIDCMDIYKIGGIQPGNFTKGFVVITTPEPLDVIGVYTSTGAAAGATGHITLDVEEVTPKRIMNADP